MKVYAVMHHVYYATGDLMCIYKSIDKAIAYCRDQTEKWGCKESIDDLTWRGSSESYEIEEMEVE